MPESGNALDLAGPAALELYERLLRSIRSLGRYEVEVKKTSIHLARGSAFAGIQPRRRYLVVTIKSDRNIPSRRIRKAEQVSKNRWHLEIKVSQAADIDRELLRWLRAAYAMSA